MRTLALWLDYDGTDFLGFGRQARGRTVQAVLEDSVRLVTGQDVRVSAAARTDAGVHAQGQVVSFPCETRLDPELLRRALNARLPDDLHVSDVRDMPEGFDARRQALSRCYRYAVWNHPRPCLWRRRYVLHVRAPLDVAAMDAAAQMLVGSRDFR